MNISSSFLPETFLAINLTADVFFVPYLGEPGLVLVASLMLEVLGKDVASPVVSCGWGTCDCAVGICTGAKGAD